MFAVAGVDEHLSRSAQRAKGVHEIRPPRCLSAVMQQPQCGSDFTELCQRHGRLSLPPREEMSDAKLFANRSALFANDAESAMIVCSLL